MQEEQKLSIVDMRASRLYMAVRWASKNGRTKEPFLNGFDACILYLNSLSEEQLTELFRDLKVSQTRKAGL